MKPAKAVNTYIENRRSEVTEETLQSHIYRLRPFIRWCGEQEISETTDLSTRDMHEYRVWRREDGDLSPASEKTQMDTIRVFIRFLERLNEVQDDLSEAVVSPALSGTDKRSEDILDPDVGQEIEEYLSTYQYASSRHIAFMLMWRTAMRTSAVRALDINDYDSDEQYIEITNRPESGTRLKNGDSGERFVAVSEELCDVLDAYCSENRIDILDDHGREPLLTTSYGRISKNTIRSWAYRLTQPCMMSDCPHDRDEDECRAAHSTDYPFECPSSVAPHAIRRGSITGMLRDDVPTPVVSDRVDAEEETLDEHYDKRSKREKMETRREYIDF